MTNSEKIWHALTVNRVDKVAYLPCNKLNTVMRYLPEDIDIWHLTKESMGLGLCFGRSLAGGRSAMFIQNTGLGNLITELYTMQKLYREALPIFVSWRGHYKEPIEAQVIFGSKIEALLNAIDVEYQILKSSDDLADIDADVAACFAQNKVVVYLLSPELWEQNSTDYHVFGRPRLSAVSVSETAYSGQPTLDRQQAIDVMMETIDDDAIVISQIGFPSKEVYTSKDRANNFYMLGALGSTTEVGIGLAQEIVDKHVYVLDGDGSFFFNPNQLFDLATFAPDNLSVVCLDNGSWGSTGNQPTLSSSGVNLTGVVKALGINNTGITDCADTFATMLNNRHTFIHYLIKAGNNKSGVEIPMSAVAIKQRFMRAIART